MSSRNWNIVNVLPVIEPHHILLCKIDLNDLVYDNTIVSNLPHLSIEEISKLHKYRFSIDKYRFGIARLAIRMLCANHLNTKPSEIELIFNKYGKPSITNNKNLQFNISHSGNVILIGLTLGQHIGVDVEVHNNEIDHMELASCVFSPTEQSQLHKASPAWIIKGFYNCWTLKESFIKAMGLGLHLPLDSFSMNMYGSNNQNKLINIQWNGAILSDWTSRNIYIEKDYTAAYTCHSSIQHIDFYNITTLLKGIIENNFLTPNLHNQYENTY